MSRLLYQLCISREFIREERDLLLEEVYIIKNYCDEIMASSLGEGLSLARKIDCFCYGLDELKQRMVMR